MAETTNRTLNVFINTGEAQKSYDKLIAKEKSLQDQMAKTTDPKQVQRLQKELDKLQEPISRAAKKLSGEMAPSMRDMQKLVKDLGNQLHHMSRTDADFSQVLQQYRQAQVELQGMRQEANSLDDAFTKTKNNNPFGRILEYAKGTLLGGAIQSIIGSFSQFLSDSVSEALSSEETTARFKNTLDNLSRSDAFDRIIEKADEMAEKFKYLDNDDVVGVFNKLIDYGKLTEQQMNDLLPVIIDFAAKQRISLEDSTDVIVKALEGQGKALKQYGIELKSGATDAENLAAVMDNLGAKVKGSAEAFQETAAGGLASAKQEFANLKEEIGNGLIPVINGLLGAVNRAMKGLGFLAGETKKVFDDAKAFFSGGIGGVKENQAQRAQQQQDANEAQAAKNLASKFSSATAAQIDAAIKEAETKLAFKENLIKAKARLLKEGAIDPAEYQQEVETTKQGIRVLTKEIAELQKIKATATGGVLGTGGVTVGGKDPDAAKAEAARKKALEEYKQLMETLAKMQDEIRMANMGARDKEFEQLAIKYQGLRDQAKGHKDALLLIDKLYHQEVQNLNLKFAKEDADADLARFKEEEKRREALFNRLAAQGQQFAQRLAQQAKEAADKQMANMLAGVQLQANQTSPFSPKRLELQKKLLDLEMQNELRNTDLTENQRALIEQQYRDKKKQAELDYWNGMVNVILQFTQQALQVLQSFDQAKTAGENRELDRDKKVNDRKKENLKRQLDQKRITQMDYDRQVAELDKKQEQKEKQVRLQQFRRQQRMAIVNALINGAQGIQKSIAEWGMPFAIPWIALTAASTAAQLAVISKQQPPEFARGGKLHGPSHNSKSRGLPVINPENSSVEAFVEGGEAITNKKTMADRNTYTVSGTPSQIISRLNGMHGVEWDSGAILVPGWRTEPPKSLPVNALNRNMRTVKLFESGGLFQSTAAPGGSAAGGQVMDMSVMLQVAATLHNLNETLAGGIHATAPVLLSDIQDAQARKQAIIDDATMKG